MPRLLAVLATLALAGTSLIACGDDEEPAAAGTAPAPTFPLTVTNCGRPVTIDAAPRRILTIGSSAASSLHAAGASDRIAARAGEFGNPPAGPAGAAIAGVPILTPEDPGTEAIIGAGVDTVIGYGLFETTPKDLSAAGITALTLSASCTEAGSRSARATTFDDVYTDIALFGKLFATQATATRAVADLERRVDAVRRQAAGWPARTAATAYFFGDTPSTNGNRNIVNAQMRVLGLENVFADVDKDFIESSTEALIKRDPDVLILAHGRGDKKDTFAAARTRFLRLPGAADMKAVREHRVIGLPSAQKEPDPAAVDGLETLARGLAAIA